MDELRSYGKVIPLGSLVLKDFLLYIMASMLLNSAQLNASVNWTHNPPTQEELDRGATTITETLNFVPEIGETSYTAFYRTCQLLAKQIVGMMEQAW